MARVRSSDFRWDVDEARLQVAQAIREGHLPHPRGMQCADCGGEAVEYEHRDYNQPLRVEPICRSCNLRRGPAIPRHGSFARLVERGFLPYRRRCLVKRLLAAMGMDPAALNHYPERLTLDHWREFVHLFPVKSEG